MSNTVLIIENDPDTLDVLCEVVASLNVNVIGKNDTVGLDELQRLNPSLILLDLRLESAFGGDYCTLIKSRPETSHLTVILMSVLPHLKDIFLKFRADGFMEKPFNLSDIENLVREKLPALA